MKTNDLELELYETKAKLQKLREAIRPLIEGLYNVYKADGYWLRVSHEKVKELEEVFKESGE